MTQFSDQFWKEYQIINSAIQSEQLLASLVILLLSAALYLLLMRYFAKHASVQKQEEAGRIWQIKQLIFPLRLTALAVALRLAEYPLPLQSLQLDLLHLLESLLVLIAVSSLLFSLVHHFYQKALVSIEIDSDALAVRHLVTVRKVFNALGFVVIASAYFFVNRELLGSWLHVFSWWRYLLAFVLIALLWSLNVSISRLLLRLTVALASKEDQPMPRLVLSSLLWPIRIVLIALIIYSLKTVLSFPAKLIQIADQSILILATLAGFLLIYNLLDIVDSRMNRLVERDDNLLDKTFAQMIRLILRLVVLTVAAIYLIQAISGKPVSALLAGLGIGALAVALAAQDTLKNLFGSVMIMADKPFEIGQRIVVDGFDGFVEAIGFRSTKLRTLTGHLVNIPNEKMAAQSIENIGRRPHIRRFTNIGISYDTPPDKVEKAVQIVRDVLENHEGMDPEFPPRVYFSEFNDYSLNIVMIYWFYPPDYWAYLAFTEKVNLKIMRAFEAEGIEFAFPTSTTYLAQDERRPLEIGLRESLLKSS